MSTVFENQFNINAFKHSNITTTSYSDSDYYDDGSISTDYETSDEGSDEPTLQNTRDLALVNSFNEDNRTNQVREIVSKQNDTFMILTRYIYETYGFEELEKFYNSTKKFKRNIDESLLEYYDYLGLNLIEKQEEVIIALINYICEYNTSFINLIFDNRDLMVLVNNYFVSKKKNIKDLDPDENDGYIISKLQLEWAHRLYNMKWLSS